MSIEPLLIRDDGPRDQCGTQQRERELDRDAEREACDHGAILMTELWSSWPCSRHGPLFN